jgi:hypothetical protein
MYLFVKTRSLAVWAPCPACLIWVQTSFHVDGNTLQVSAGHFVLPFCVCKLVLIAVSYLLSCFVSLKFYGAEYAAQRVVF